MWQKEMHSVPLRGSNASLTLHFHLLLNVLGEKMDNNEMMNEVENTPSEPAVEVQETNTNPPKRSFPLWIW